MLRSATLLAALFLLAGCSGPSSPPYITREQAIAVASQQVDTRTLEIRAADLVEKFAVGDGERPVWRVAYQTRDQQRLQATYYVDAVTGEVVWMTNPPGQGTRVSRVTWQITHVPSGLVMPAGPLHLAPPYQ